MPKVFEDIFNYLKANNYHPNLVVEDGLTYIMCPYTDELLSDDKMREYNTKGITSWGVDIAKHSFGVVVYISVYDTPTVYGASLNITIQHKNSTSFDGKELAHKKSYVECYQKVYEDLAERLKATHNICIDFSNKDGHPFFETFDGQNKILYKYDIYRCS